MTLQEYYTKQEYYNKTVVDLLGRSCEDRAIVPPARSAVTTCRYLTEDGRKCAVGIHIPDGHPAQHLQMTVADLEKVHPELAGIAWPIDGIALAVELQGVHDLDKFWDDPGLNIEGLNHLNSIALQFELNRPTELLDALDVVS